MVRAFSAATLLFAFIFIASALADDKKPVSALPPHPLDNAFERCNSERDLTNALLNNQLYQRAVAEALKAKRAQEAMFKANPRYVGPSPAQAARVTFLEVLMNEAK